MYTLVYTIKDELNPKTVYVNLTNACTNNCVFCLRNQKDDVCGANMWHDDEYSFDDIVTQFQQYSLSVQEVVFCGYGEPFLRKEMLKAFAKYLRINYPQIKIRINTNGHANAVYKTNIVNEFVGLVDEISVSLNSDDAYQYNQICNPKISDAYNEVKKFIKSCNQAGIKTVASVVTNFDKVNYINIENCEKIAKELGAEFKNREFISNGY